MLPRPGLLLCTLCSLGYLVSGSTLEGPPPSQEGDMISFEGEKYPRLFEPTHEFQVIKQGQEIPAGEKEAKINDPNEVDDTDTDTTSHTLSLKDIQIIDDPESRQKRKKLVQTYDAIQHHQSSESPGLLSTDYETFLDAVASLGDPASSGDTLKIALTNLEALSHDREYGIKLVNDQDTLDRLVETLKTHTDPQVRQSSARIIGSSLLNNPESQSIVSGSGFLTRLLECLQTETDNAVKASLVFALNAAVATEHDMRELMKAQGSQVLRQVYQSGESEVRGKCATFVEDKVLLYYRVIQDIEAEISSWCGDFQRSLISAPSPPETDLTQQKLLSSLMYTPPPQTTHTRGAALMPSAMKKQARDECHTEPEFLVWLADRVTAYPSEASELDGVEELVREARHLFGNPKAARKTAWEDKSERVKDEL